MTRTTSSRINLNVTGREVTYEDPDQLRPVLSADALTQGDRPRRAVRRRQHACHVYRVDVSPDRRFHSEEGPM